MADTACAAGPDPVARLTGATVPAWNGDEDDTLVCRAVRQETTDVKTFVLTAPEPRRFDFLPGQFVTFEMEIGGQTLFRSYTIASAPTRPFALEVTVKRVPGGPVSNWLHDNLAPGASLKATLPMGEFTCVHAPAPKYLFLSGGSGITPLMSMTRTLTDLGEGRDIVFVHAARSPADIVFRDELATMARRNAGLRVTHVCEADNPFEQWGGHRGRLTPAMLAAIAPDLAAREVFVCGPAPFMAAVRTMLKEMGHDPTRYHEESFTFEDLPLSVQADVAEAEAGLEAAPAVPVYRVEFTRTRRSIECPADIPILEAARRAGVRLPSSCAKGVCGTCKSKIASGTFVQAETGGIRPREIAAGMALLCSARATSDLVIDR